MNLQMSKINWDEEPNRREKMIFALALVVFLLTFIRSIWYPSMDAISVVRGDIDILMEEEAALSSTPGGNEAPESKQWKGTEKQRERYNTMAKGISDDPNIVLMREFSNPAMLRGTKVTGINFEEAKIENGVIVQPWKLGLYGSFISVGEYLERLEGLPMLTIIDSIDVRVVSDASGHVNAGIEGVVYGWK